MRWERDPARLAVLHHNERVAAVFTKLLNLIEPDDAYDWMVSYCPPLKDKPIDMIDDDEKYERLLGALNELEEGSPS